MLRRMEGLGAMGLGRMDWDRAAALGRRAMIWTALATAMFVLCRAQILNYPAPFAMAFLTAALLAGRSASALLAGCVTGALNGSIQNFDLRLPVGAAIVLGGGILWEQFGPRLAATFKLFRGPHMLRRQTAQNTAPGVKARSPTPATSALCPTLAGIAVLVPGLVFAGDELWPMAAQVAAASVAAVAAAPFFGSVLEVGFERRWLDQEERFGVFMLLGALTAGLSRVYPPLALCACGALTLLLYPCGALTGIGFGASLLIAGVGDARLWAMIAVGGATAQLCGELSRPARGASACGVMVLAGLLLNVPPLMLAGAGASAMAAMAVPQSWAESLCRLARHAPTPKDPLLLADRARRASARQLRALSAAFGELAEGYLTSASLPDEQALMGRLRAQLCDGCAGYAACWAGERNAGARFLCDLIAQAVALSGEAPLFEGEVPPDILRRCRRGRLIPERVQELLEDFARTRRAELKRGAENRLISAQFFQAQQMLDGIADRQEISLRRRDGLTRTAAAALERAGVEAESVMAVEGRRIEIVVSLGRGSWTPELLRAASVRLAAAFGRPYASTRPAGRVVRFVRRPRLGVKTGAVCVSGEAGAPSGDNHLICMLDDERLLVLICDGMGRGEDAARESAVAVRLLGRFLRAGATCGLAIETVNALLLNRGGEDMFATMDMLVLNLSTGEAEFAKLAACPTLIARGSDVRRIEGGRLPLGILEKVSPGVSRTRLLPGDVLLMGSDGVMEAAAPSALEALLLDEQWDMAALAHRALAEAEAACEDGRRDDMTAICLKIKSRGGEN